MAKGDLLAFCPDILVRHDVPRSLCFTTAALPEVPDLLLYLTPAMEWIPN